MYWHRVPAGDEIRQAPDSHAGQQPVRGFGLKDYARDICESVLIQRVVLNGDNGAFDQLVKRHSSRVRGFVRRLCRDRDIADDIAQDAFILAYRRLYQFKGESGLDSWLLGIAYRCFLQHQRKQQRWPEPCDDPDAAVNDANTNASALADHIDLEKALATLNPTQVAALTLNLSMGYSHAEVAEIMALPLGTTKSTISRSLDKLRTLMNAPPLSGTGRS